MEEGAPARPASASLRRHFSWLLLGVAAMLVGGVGLSLWFRLQIDRQNQLDLLNMHAGAARDGVKRRLDNYRTLVDGLARDPELEELLRVGDPLAQQGWVQSRRTLIPDLHGLTLLTPGGEVLGDATTLRIGQKGRDELASGNPLHGQRLHLRRDASGHSHIDLVSPVRGSGDALLGGIFMSMHLDALQRILNDSVFHGQAFTLLDGEGRTVVRSGKVAGAVREIRLDVGEAGWTLAAQMSAATAVRSGRIQIVVGVATLLAVLLLLETGMLRLRRAMLRDIDATRDALTALANDEPVPPIVPHYAEFEQTFADINRVALHLQAQRSRLEHLSLTDPLTGLPNRRAFETRFSQALGFAERGHRIALVLLDIDRFKRINDSFGHGVGDQVLLALAQTLKTLTRRADLAVRLAGDEFAILLSDLDEAGVTQWYQRLNDHFAGELAAFGLDVQTGISAGQTWLGGIGHDSMNQALARADRALYLAKERGRGQLVLDASAAENGAG